MNKRFIECVLPETDGRFHYHLPPELEDRHLVGGLRLLVPFGSGWKMAFFVRPVAHPDVPNTKAVRAVLDEESLFSAKLFKLLLWISAYYQTPLGALMKTALPQGIHALPRRQFRLDQNALGGVGGIRSSIQLEILERLKADTLENGAGTRVALWEAQLRKQVDPKGLSRALAALKKKGFIHESWALLPSTVKPKLEGKIVLNATVAEAEAYIKAHQKSAPKQADILQILIKTGAGLALAALGSASQRAAARRLVQKGIVERIDAEVSRMPPREAAYRKKGEITLNKDQEAAAAFIESAIEKGIFSPVLLHGVTGSGKTEVYLRAIESVVARGKAAILLLPEIGLTTHIAARFYERFGDRVALLHSGLSPGERYDEWRRIREGEVDVAIGARSAIFAPFRSLGAIIIDEEHDPSYRQGEGSRYHARDVAMVRGRDEKALVILGSATPSFESYYNSQSGKYALLHLPERIDDRPLPTVHLIDLKEKSAWVRPFFTLALIDAIKKRLDAREQVLLFVNRRGFSPFLLCRDCGYAPSCIHCSVSLTYHKEMNRLCCHYCGYRAASPADCPQCHGVEVQSLGIGTEQVEESIRALFPFAKVARLDRDTTQKKGAQAKILNAMDKEVTDILIGTQMIAKGHDFPKVTLVGVLSADMSLHLPDFRSSERTFQLLTQVAGRAGRGERPGEVIFQTFHPENIAIEAATRQDFPSFYQQGILSREESNYPPFCRITLILLKHRREAVLVEEATALADVIKRSCSGGALSVLGPAPASRLRIKQWYRYHILLKGKDQQQIAKVLRPAIDRWRQNGKQSAQIEVEIDPQQFS